MTTKVFITMSIYHHCTALFLDALISFDSPENNNIASYSKSCQENSYKSHETDCSTYYHCGNLFF